MDIYSDVPQGFPSDSLFIYLYQGISHLCNVARASERVSKVTYNDFEMMYITIR